MLRVLPYLPASRFVHEFLENAAAVFVAFKLVEAGAGRGQQHHVARMSRGSGGVTALSRVSQEWIVTTPRRCDSIFAAAEPMV